MKQKIKEWLLKQSLYQNLKQALLIVTVFFAFLISVCIGRSEDLKGHIVFLVLTWISGAVCVIGWTDVARRKICCFLYGTGRKRARKRKWKLGCFLVLLYTVMIRLPQLGDIPRFDGLAYYNMLSEACRSYDFTFTGFLNGFRMASHPTQGYMGLLAIGRFLDPTGYTGIMLVNLILAAATSRCVFMILRKLIKGVSWKAITAVSILMTSVPSYLGTFSYMNPDMGLIYFFLMAVYCMLYSRYILMIFSLLLLALTKEAGMVIAAAYLTGMALWLMWEKRRTIINGVTRKRLFYAGFAGIILLLVAVTGIYIVLGGTVWNYQREEIEYFGTVGFHPEFIIFKLKEYFLLNFSWIAVLLIFVGLVFLWRKKGEPLLRSREKAVIVGSLLSYAAIAVFYSLYVNFPHPRYTIILDVILWMTAAGVSGKAAAVMIREKGWKDLIYRRAVLGGCMLLLIQSYVTVDPVSILSFVNNPTGAGWLLDIYTEFIGWTGGGDATVYNNQYRFPAVAYDYVLRDVQYDEGMDVIMLGGLDELDDPLWDRKKAERTFEENEDTTVISSISLNNLEEVAEKKEKAVFLYASAFGGDRDWELETVGEYYDLVYNGIVYIPGGGIVEYWKCNLKEMS